MSSALADSITASLAAAAEMQQSAGTGSSTHRRTASVVAGGDIRPTHSGGSALSIVPQQARSWRDVLQKASSLRTTDDLAMLAHHCRMHDPPLFPSLSDDALFNLSAYLCMTSFRRGQVLYHEGERLAFVFMMLAPGSVALSQSENGVGADQTAREMQQRSRPGSSAGPHLAPPTPSSGSHSPMSPLRMKLNKIRGGSSMHSRSGGSAMGGGRGSTAPLPVADDVAPSRLLALVQPGMLFGARFSSSIAGLVPPPLTAEVAHAAGFESQQAERHYRHTIISSHTATAKPNVHVLCLSLDIFLKFFPDSTATAKNGETQQRDEQEFQLAQQPAVHVTEEKEERSAVQSASPLRSKPTSGSLLHPSSAAATPSRHPLGSDLSQLSRSELPNSTVSPRPRERILAHALSDVSIGVLPHKGERSASAAAAAAHSQSAASLPLYGAAPADVAASADSAGVSTPSVPGLHLKPLQLHVSESEPTIKILPADGSSASAVASAASSRPISAVVSPAAARPIQSTSASPQIRPMNLPSPMLRQLKARGEKMWHVLQDAVGLQVHMHKQAKAAGKPVHSTSAASSGAPSARALEIEAELASVPENEDISEIPLDEDEETQLKRRLKFLRSVPLGGISRWSQDKLLKFAMGMEDRRYAGRAVIYRQSDPSTHVFFIHTGCIQLQRTLSESAHYLDLYTDHLGSAADEKLAAKSFAKTPMDVTTGAGVLRKISFEAVAALHPNPGQDDLRTTVRPAGAKHGGSYTLLREMDFVSGKLSRSSSDQFFAVQFLHTSHSLRITLNAHRGSADLFVCNSTLLPSASKHTWMGSTNLSAKENAQWANMMGQGQQGRHRASNSSTGGASAGNHHSSGSISTISPGTPNAEMDPNGGGSMPGSPMPQHGPHGSISFGSLNAPSSSSTSSSSSGSTPARSCEILISRLHPAFRNGWFYLCVSSKGSSCDYSLRLAAVPLESNSWKVGSAKKARAPLGLASLGRYSVFGLEGVLNSAARDEEAVSLGQTLLYAMPREEFLAAFGPGHGFSAAVSQSASLANGPSYSLSTSTSSSSSHSANPALALQDLIRQTSNTRLHRAHLHQATLQVQQVLQSSPGSSEALKTTLDHYAKVEARQTMVEQSLQRAEERKAAKAKALRAGQVLTASAASAADPSGLEQKKPLLTADTQKLRINHAYRRRPVASAGRNKDEDDADEAANARDTGVFSFEAAASSSQKLPNRAAALRNDASIAGLGPDDTHVPQIVQATGTTGPSQRRHRAGAEEATKKHVLGDEVRMLASFLAEEAHGHRPPEKPAELHHALLARQLQEEHDALIARSKIDHGVDPTKRIALDMHALHRRDVTVVGEEVAAVAESASLDDILQNRVAVALPPPERLLATEKGVHALALARAPAFKLAEAPPPPKPGLRIKHSDTFNTTALLMTAQLGRRGLEDIMAEARANFVMAVGPDGTSDPAALEALAAAFEPEVQPSSLLAIESGEWVPEPMPQTTPRPAGSPSRRGQKAAELAKSASQPALDLKQKRKKSGVPNLRATRTSLAIYATDDPAVEALKEFNRSIPATYAREQEFAHAFRATGKEKRVRDTDLRPAARPSHPLAGPQRLQSLVDAAPLALQKAWPLLESPNASMARSHSTPMLLMPGTGRKLPQSSAGKDDSSIFDLTSVDAQEPEPELTSESPSAVNGGATVESGAATPKPSAGDISSRRRSALLDSLVSESVLPGSKQHVYLPSTAAMAESNEAARLSHRSFAGSEDATSSEGTLVPFSSPSDAPSFAAAPSSPLELPSTSLITLSGGIAFSPLPLDGLGAGGIVEDLPSIGVGYQFAPNNLQPLKPRPFPGSMPAPQRIQELAREMGHVEGGGVGRVSRALVNQESLEFARERHAAQHHSAPFVDHSTHSAAFRSKQREMMPWAAKEARVAYLASLAEAEEAAAAAATQEQKEYETPRRDDLARATTAMGIREEQEDGAGGEEWDATDAAALSPSTANRAAPRASSASRMRPSASVGSLPHSSVSRSLHKKSVPALELTGSVAHVYPHPMSPGSHAPIGSASPPLGSSQSVSNLAGSNSTRLSRPSSSKHGHPARVGPAHMSLSSSDVPAMTWLQDRIRAAAEAEAEGSHAPRDASPSSMHLDAQAIIRPITSPLSGFRSRASSASGARAGSGSGGEESSRSINSQKKKPKKKYFKAQLKDSDRAAARAESAGTARSNGAETRPDTAVSAAEDENGTSADPTPQSEHPPESRRRSLSPASLARVVSEAASASRRGSHSEQHSLKLAEAKLRRLTDEAKTKEILEAMRNQETSAVAAPANDGSSSSHATTARHAVDFSGLPPVPRHAGARPATLLAASPAEDALRGPDSSSSSPVIVAARTHHRAFSTSSTKAGLASVAAFTPPPLARTPSMTRSALEAPQPAGATQAGGELPAVENAGASVGGVSARAAKPEASVDTVSPVEEEAAVASVAAIDAILAAHPHDRPTSFLAPNRLRSLPVPVVKAPDVYVRPKMQLFVNHPLHRF